MPSGFESSVVLNVAKGYSWKTRAHFPQCKQDSLIEGASSSEELGECMMDFRYEVEEYSLWLFTGKIAELDEEYWG
jgi:hypothetical protein